MESITYNYSSGDDSGTSSGTTIVIVIAVLVVLIPTGFLVQYIIRKIRERRQKLLNNNTQSDMMQLPDQS